LDELRRQDEACVCHLQTVLFQRQPHVSQQLRLLRAAGVIDCRKDGLFVYYRLADPQVVQVLEALLGPGGRRSRFAVCGCPACQAGRHAAEAARVLAVH
jgi:ArsR family transcriptional regulator